MLVLAWVASYADGRQINGRLPEQLPGAAVPRDGLIRFELLQGNPDNGWTPILAVDLAEHERLVFRRRMMTTPLAHITAQAIGLIVGSYDTRADTYSLLYLHGDGAMTLRAATSDVAVEPHEEYA